MLSDYDRVLSGWEKEQAKEVGAARVPSHNGRLDYGASRYWIEKPFRPNIIRDIRPIERARRASIIEPHARLIINMMDFRISQPRDALSRFQEAFPACKREFMARRERYRLYRI